MEPQEHKRPIRLAAERIESVESFVYPTGLLIQVNHRALMTATHELTSLDGELRTTAASRIFKGEQHKVSKEEVGRKKNLSRNRILHSIAIDFKFHKVSEGYRHV